MATHPGSGRFAIRHALAITFIAVALCVAGVYSALHMPSSVFPQTDFPRVVMLVNNGIMPADEMMATITRPIEEAMKDIPGTVSVRSATERGSAQINVFFDWHVDMVQSELYVLGRLSQISSELPPTASTEVERLTFSAFPDHRRQPDQPDARPHLAVGDGHLQPQAALPPDSGGGQGGRGGRAACRNFMSIVDPVKLQAANLSLADVTGALVKNNLIAPAGMLEENYHLYLTTVDGRAHSAADIENLVITANAGHPVRVKDFARVERGPEPTFTVVTAEGRNAALLNIVSQPNGSTLEIANALKEQLKQLRKELPPDMHLAFFYDQSQFVRESVGSVWDAIVFGLILSVLILFFFLKNWGSVLTAIVTIPVTVLITLVAMKLVNMSFNMMTLGGIAAAIGLVIDDAIVVVEAIFTKIAAGRPRLEGIQEGIGEIYPCRWSARR